MNGKIKTTTAFRAITARRHDESNARKTHVVKSVNKDGSISKAAFTTQDWQQRSFTSAEAAEARRIELERLNPGSRFAVVAL